MIKNGSAAMLCLQFWKTKQHSDKLSNTAEEPCLATEGELKRLERNITQLLHKLAQYDDEPPSSPDEECVICVSGKASMQTFPCGHTVLCRRCFIKTIQIALCERNFPLRCVVCRSQVLRLKQQSGGRRVAVRPSRSTVVGNDFSIRLTPPPQHQQPLQLSNTTSNAEGGFDHCCLSTPVLTNATQYSNSSCFCVQNDVSRKTTAKLSGVNAVRSIFRRLVLKARS